MIFNVNCKKLALLDGKVSNQKVSEKSDTFTRESIKKPSCHDSSAGRRAAAAKRGRTRFRRGKSGRFRPGGDAAIIRCGIAIPAKSVYT